MNNLWIILSAVAIFLLLNIFFYIAMKGYSKETLGKKWLSKWGNKVYFWQGSIFVSTAGTVLFIFLLKWSDILTF